jgi:hypothetical protein
MIYDINPNNQNYVHYVGETVTVVSNKCVPSAGCRIWNIERKNGMKEILPRERWIPEAQGRDHESGVEM